jgi:hypothetical protein
MATRLRLTERTCNKTAALAAADAGEGLAIHTVRSGRSL